MARIGILALQGDVAEHERMVGASGGEPVRVKRVDQLQTVDGLIIPGGESTTIGKLLIRFGFMERLQAKVREGFPVFGTCAGMILLANDIQGAGVEQPKIGGMDITVERNAFGRQRESFETDLHVPEVGDEPVHAVFIRAPSIKRVGAGVRVLATLPDRTVVAARQQRLLAASFHPELAGDDRMHRYFAEMTAEPD